MNKLKAFKLGYAMARGYRFSKGIATDSDIKLSESAKATLREINNMTDEEISINSTFNALESMKYAFMTALEYDSDNYRQTVGQAIIDFASGLVDFGEKMKKNQHKITERDLK